jgi:misacylated tRNA(Ala) deacylase
MPETRLRYRDDPYLREAESAIVATGDGTVTLAAPLFYPQGGGQPGDSGWLDWPDGSTRVETTVKFGDEVVLVIEGAMPPEGTEVLQRLDWDRRYRHMRVHTALHLLSVVVPLPVTGGQIGAGRGRLDFDMPEAPADRNALEARLNELVAADLPVGEDWITDAALAANPDLVKTMSVKPPTGTGRVRLIRIGAREAPVDLQPCGGTHVARTAEIGRLRLGKIEKKGARNRRIAIEIEP